MDKTQGQLDYEADVARMPLYHDGTPRKTWNELSEYARWSWDHPGYPDTEDSTRHGGDPHAR